MHEYQGVVNHGELLKSVVRVKGRDWREDSSSGLNIRVIKE